MRRHAADTPPTSSTVAGDPTYVVDRTGALSQLVEDYATNLREQAAVLLGLTGHLQVENHAEAGAYLAVAEDLTRILAGDLTQAGFSGA